MGIEHDVPVGDPVEKYLSYAWELADSSTIANRTCRTIPGSISRTIKKINGYSLSQGGSISVTAEVGLSNSPYMPLVVQAKTSAMSSVTITNAFSREEEMSFTTGVGPAVEPCHYVTSDYYWFNANVEVKQTFVTRVTCNIQGGSNPFITICNSTTAVATSQGTNYWYTDVHGGYLGDCCPPPPPPPSGPPAAS